MEKEAIKEPTNGTIHVDPFSCDLGEDQVWMNTPEEDCLFVDIPAKTIKAKAVVKPVEHDPVHQPKHYQGKTGKFQAIDVIHEFELNYCLGNVCKYLLRASRKHESPLEDKLKAVWYLCRDIQNGGNQKELKEFLEKQLKEIK